jgi:hypothetical protein
VWTDKWDIKTISDKRGKGEVGTGLNVTCGECKKEKTSMNME